MSQPKKTLVLGASPNPSRFSYKAVIYLENQGHPVIAAGKSAGSIGNTVIKTDSPAEADVDTLSLYLSPQNQKAEYEYILKTIRPKRIIFNPGAENPELISMAQKAGIETVEDCTLVMLTRGTF